MHFFTSNLQFCQYGLVYTELSGLAQKSKSKYSEPYVTGYWSAGQNNCHFLQHNLFDIGVIDIIKE